MTRRRSIETFGGCLPVFTNRDVFLEKLQVIAEQRKHDVILFILKN
ncbi:MAG: hypothetical protein JXQ23_05215 [Clostridia bacterium]|nr:hypothetical protein [Clostridia bacterium]